MTKQTIPTKNLVLPLRADLNFNGELYPPDLNARKVTKSVMESKYLHNGEPLLNYMLGKVKQEVKEPNLTYLLGYVRHMQLDGKNPRTIARHLRELRFAFSFMNKDAKKAERLDLEKVVLGVNDSKKAPISKRKILLTIRVFWKFLYKTDEYPQVVKFIKPGSTGASKKTAQEMLTQEEIKRMIEFADNQLDKTLIIFMASTGTRIGEILSCKISSLQISEDPKTLSFVKVSGKTGERTIALLSEAVPYLKNYIETERRYAKSNDPLFIYKKRALDFHDVRHILKKLITKAGIKKRVHSHLFRYYLSSYMASKGMQESQMAMYFGYSPQIASYYTKLSNVNDVIARLNGLDVNKEIISRDLLASKSCNKCGRINEFSAKLCVNCLNELNNNLNEEMEQLKKDVSDLKDMSDYLINFLKKKGLMTEAEQEIKNRN